MRTGSIMGYAALLALAFVGIAVEMGTVSAAGGYAGNRYELPPMEPVLLQTHPMPGGVSIHPPVEPPRQVLLPRLPSANVIKFARICVTNLHVPCPLACEDFFHACLLIRHCN